MIIGCPKVTPNSNTKFTSIKVAVAKGTLKLVGNVGSLRDSLVWLFLELTLHRSCPVARQICPCNVEDVKRIDPHFFTDLKYVRQASVRGSNVWINSSPLIKPKSLSSLKDDRAELLCCSGCSSMLA